MGTALAKFWPVATLAAVCSVSRPAHADPNESKPWSARLLEGTSPGDPSTGKTATVLTLYVASAASLATGFVSMTDGLSKESDADAYRDVQPDGFCLDRTAPNCQDYLRQRRAQDDAYRLADLAFAGSAVFLISGALVAELWKNEAPPPVTATVTPDGASLGFKVQF
jgi:hypothetical protein